MVPRSASFQIPPPRHGTAPSREGGLVVPLCLFVQRPYSTPLSPHQGTSSPRGRGTPLQARPYLGSPPDRRRAAVDLQRATLDCARNGKTDTSTAPPRSRHAASKVHHSR